MRRKMLQKLHQALATIYYGLWLYNAMKLPPPKASLRKSLHIMTIKIQ
jgi:hypothetical protein